MQPLLEICPWTICASVVITEHSQFLVDQRFLIQGPKENLLLEVLSGCVDDAGMRIAYSGLLSNSFALEY